MTCPRVGGNGVPSNMATIKPTMAVSGLPKLVLKAGVFTGVDELGLVVHGMDGSSHPVLPSSHCHSQLA